MSISTKLTGTLQASFGGRRIPYIIIKHINVSSM